MTSRFFIQNRLQLSLEAFTDGWLNLELCQVEEHRVGRPPWPRKCRPTKIAEYSQHLREERIASKDVSLQQAWPQPYSSVRSVGPECGEGRLGGRAGAPGKQWLGSAAETPDQSSRDQQQCPPLRGAGLDLQTSPALSNPGKEGGVYLGAHWRIL